MNPPDLTAYLSRPSPVEGELRRLFPRETKALVRSFAGRIKHLVTR